MNKIYTKICEFKYGTDKYLLLIDNDHKQFFLKILEDGRYSYVTDNELIKLCRIFSKRPVGYNAKKDKVKLIPKIISLAAGGAIVLNLTTCNYLYSMFNSYEKLNNSYKSNDTKKNYSVSDTIENNYSGSDTTSPSETTDYSDKKIKELLDSISTTEEKRYVDGELKIDSYIESPFSQNVYIFETQYLDNYLHNKKSDVTIDTIRKTIQSNNKISDRFKKLLNTYCDYLSSEYPDVDLRIFNYNLKTLEVVEGDKWDLLSASLSADSYGCYRKDENKIYVIKDYEYTSGTWEYQVIMHEFSHVLRCGWWNIDGKDMKVVFEDSDFFGSTIEEAMNSIFTIKMYDKEEQDIAYQLQSNYLQLILENMDNYKLSDYVNYNISYFEKKLNEYNQSEDAVKILALIETQYKDYHDDSIEIEQKEFYPIYDYIANMVYKNNLYAGMSYDEAKNVCDYMVSRMTFDVPTEYNIDIEHIYQHFNEYCTSLGISNSLSR